ncbi:hypothetical protein [Parageobacillus thermoglucosidasius]|uniref:Uncharacterized protein n=3 Tax=Anoxybacillaceae TaxID=3120669 RepID=A0AAN1D847_PARTM|nr:hypothetical protein [Parageobacillus thermoglucosidasius]KYD14013.1 hypothetical protein B4168_0835 [Anoxybacillus flavithermus]REK55851.1 MAG: hypothetical protein C6P36_11845 [Geobacillus sp.]AEH46929.1 hypothetical protein Geoth_0931 [Parageobacillus thermoglucosidasius C56-YS93]ALF11760.1 hypothetical protein AOT13_17980 [Parageobacillus thermoglucosidasius]ANZ31843.1 hypothetical protein BCV53_18040 [Parageobacillus thermoglucosidasius]
MSPWVGLLKKEWRISKLWIFTTVGIVIAVNIVAYLLSLKYDEPLVMFVPSLIVTCLHDFYMLMFMALSLQTEAKRLHLWLHTPQPAFRLVGAKLVIAFGSMLISLFVSALFTYIALLAVKERYFHAKMWNHALFIEKGALVVLSIMLLSIHIAILGLLYWVIYRICKQMIPKMAWLAVTLAYFLIGWLFLSFMQTDVYEWLTEWGKIAVPGAVFKYDAAEGWIMIEKMEMMPIGVIVFYGMMDVLIFCASVWLIDRKVEV